MGGRGQSMARSKGGVATPNGNVKVNQYDPIIAQAIPDYGTPLSLEQINQSGKYIALTNNGRTYDATYDSKLGAMFFAIPASENVIAYFKSK